MTVTAAMVKELREKTGAGMMDCKKALMENNGDFEQSVDWLRTKGIAKAAKKSDRSATEGLVAVASNGKKAVVVEVNAETDFVAKNDTFKTFVQNLANLALEHNIKTVEDLLKANLNGSAVQDTLTEMVATIGEHMSVRRVAEVESTGVVGAYLHAGGKIGAIVAIDGSSDEAVAKQIAMHIAAANPLFLNRDSVDPVAVERERHVFTDQAIASGKPAAIVEKMVEGRINKYYQEVCLVDQAFVINPDLTVAKVAAEKGGVVTAYVRFGLGEGLVKEVSDFAAEVAATIAG